MSQNNGFEVLTQGTSIASSVSIMPRNSAGKGIEIRHVIVKGETTTVVWADGMETSVTCQGGDIFDAEKAVMACFVKKIYGNKGRFNKVLADATDPVNGKLVIHSVKQA